MVKLEWGTKRTCHGCGSRFYDLRKTPIACPKCGASFEIQVPTRGRRGRGAVTEVTKDVGVGLDEAILVDDIELVEDLDPEIEDDGGLMEDTSDLGEDLDDIPDVLDHEVEGEEV